MPVKLLSSGHKSAVWRRSAENKINLKGIRLLSDHRQNDTNHHITYSSSIASQSRSELFHSIDFLLESALLREKTPQGNLLDAFATQSQYCISTHLRREDSNETSTGIVPKSLFRHKVSITTSSPLHACVVLLHPHSSSSLHEPTKLDSPSFRRWYHSTAWQEHNAESFCCLRMNQA